MAKITFGEGITLEASLPTAVDSSAAPREESITGPIAGLQSVDLKPIEGRLDAMESRIADALDKSESCLKELNTNTLTITELDQRVAIFNQKIIEIDKEPPSEIIQPTIKTITIHKDHSAELSDLSSDIRGSVIKMKKLIDKKMDNQMKINLALGAGLVVSVISHLL